MELSDAFQAEKTIKNKSKGKDDYYISYMSRYRFFAFHHACKIGNV